VDCTQGDIYSFAIILHEIAARAGTWGQSLEPREIVQRIRNRYVQIYMYVLLKRQCHEVVEHGVSIKQLFLVPIEVNLNDFFLLV